MTALTQRSHTRRAHLRLVTSDDRATTWTPVRTPIDPEAGPKDVSSLVNRFARLLPGDDGCDGVFSLGSL
jgi:hypothetical protein